MIMAEILSVMIGSKYLFRDCFFQIVSSCSNVSIAVNKFEGLAFLGGLLTSYSRHPELYFPRCKEIVLTTKMSLLKQQRVVVVGAGPVGALAALYAASRGDDVEVYELRAGQ